MISIVVSTIFSILKDIVDCLRIDRGGSLSDVRPLVFRFILGGLKSGIS